MSKSGGEQHNPTTTTIQYTFNGYTQETPKTGAVERGSLGSDQLLLT
jgi:hypothetical protein